MHVFISDLNEDAPGFGEEFAGGHKDVADVGEVRVDADSPAVAESPNLLRLSGAVFGVLLVLAFPNKLGVEGRVSGVEHGLGGLLVLGDEVA